jgi:hypothetical protein
MRGCVEDDFSTPSDSVNTDTLFSLQRFELRGALYSNDVVPSTEVETDTSVGAELLNASQKHGLVQRMQISIIGS